MIDLARAQTSDRIMKALTGLTRNEFAALVARFADHLRITFQTLRKVNPDRGKPPALKTPQEKLFYILFYVKCYPTFDLAGWIFGVDKSTCCRWAQWYMAALRRTLGRELVLPRRKIRTPRELLVLVPELQALLIDGTERPIRRPQDPQRQKHYYSGKKKRHTVKNLLLTTPRKQILYLSPTCEGKRHDYQCFKDQDIGGCIPRKVGCWVDTGFLGIEKDFPDLRVTMPKKKPKGRELSRKDKQRNRKISSFRVVAEHAVAGVKRFRIVSDVYRNLRKGFEDEVMDVACGLWNYHVKTA